MLDLDAIKRRADAASPGPWEGDVTGVYDDIARKMCPMFVHRDEDEPQAEANAVFMAHARQDVPALIAEVERLRGILTETEHVIADLVQVIGMDYDPELHPADTLRQFDAALGERLNL